ncbi:hypothetical protein RHMOL_Rhmol13G0214200 [Rhododendron molle]|uniref:Uncharacterized protein n=1 Tax=Rhododendron molle TaxID=49168 RepID=A0ACC0L937_RHOML|nr:hypothetical protein RHMOL_Rhmol13G0214200 [Rhododendron molle]
MVGGIPQTFVESRKGHPPATTTNSSPSSPSPFFPFSQFQIPKLYRFPRYPQLRFLDSLLSSNWRDTMVNPEENSNWLVDYGVIENIPVPGGDLPSLEPGFDWCPDALACSTGLRSADFSPFSSNCLWILKTHLGIWTVLRNVAPERGLVNFFPSIILLPYYIIQMRPESCSASDSKACREKMRRDRLNERHALSISLFLSLCASCVLFLELSSILEPGRKPKVDKAAILSDAVQTLTQLRDEAQKLKESSDSLQEKINELKAEKNELRDEKQKLKVEKEKLEQQLKAMSSQPAFFPYPSGIPTPFGAPAQVVGSKLVPFMGYPGVPMWQFMPPTAVDTSEDHALRPPVA